MWDLCIIQWWKIIHIIKYNSGNSKQKFQPEPCLAAPQSQPGRGTGYRALLMETLTGRAAMNTLTHEK